MYLTSILTLYAGDVIATGGPDRNAHGLLAHPLLQNLTHTTGGQ
jgi:2-keto-4-pentenoate hydratase/2-oxohepta-3-ene-1,7-dioic acid hydratase in catechol pathway